VRDPDDPAGRRTRDYWHQFPKDDGWKKVTLAHQERERFQLQPCCRSCWHRGPPMTPAEVAAWANVSMETPIIALATRLVCSKCGLPAGYFHGHNPAVL
jgi:hypothetical protein